MTNLILRRNKKSPAELKEIANIRMVKKEEEHSDEDKEERSDEDEGEHSDDEEEEEHSDEDEEEHSDEDKEEHTSKYAYTKGENTHSIHR